MVKELKAYLSMEILWWNNRMTSKMVNTASGQIIYQVPKKYRNLNIPFEFRSLSKYDDRRTYKTENLI